MKEVKKKDIDYKEGLLRYIDYPKRENEIQILNKKEDEKIGNDYDHLLKKRFWRAHDIATFLECSVGHIYNLSSRNLIPKIKKGKFLIFDPVEIIDWINQGDFYER